MLRRKYSEANGKCSLFQRLYECGKLASSFDQSKHDSFSKTLRQTNVQSKPARAIAIFLVYKH